MRLIFVLGIILLSAAAKAEIKSSLILAVDYSGSYVSDRKPGELEKLFDTVNSFLSEAAEALPANVSFKALAISATSSVEKPDCEAEGYARGLFGGGKATEGDQYLVTPKRRSENPSEFRQFLDEICVPRLLVRSKDGADGTDISGAIDTVTTIANEETKGPKVLVIMSDFYEYRDELLPDFTIDLDNYRILMVYRTVYDFDENSQAKLTRKKAEEWKKNFEDAGAESVFLMDERATKAIDNAVRALL